jgi:hypothetical protein
MKVHQMSELHASADWLLLEDASDDRVIRSEEQYSPRTRFLIVLLGALAAWAMIILPAWLLLR